MIGGWFFPPALAATRFTIEDIGGSVGLRTTDLKASSVAAISWVLGIAALVALTFVIIGFAMNWVSSGDSEVVRKRARRVLITALVGLMIILLAWAIVIFVAGTTRNVTM